MAYPKVGDWFNCTNCGTELYRKRSEFTASGRYFCSSECYKIIRKEGAKSYVKLGIRHAHRVVAEQKLGRKLLPTEIVHHKDEDKRNPAPENLEVLPSQAVHASLHFKGKKQSDQQVRKRVESRRATLTAQRRSR